MSVEEGVWFENQKEVEERLPLSSNREDYDITSPTVELRTFDPNTATFDDLLDFVATLAKDIMG